MALKMERREAQPAAPAVEPGVRTVEPRPEEKALEKTVLCQHGIHTGRFPVGGLTVKEARATLKTLLNIDPQAVAVIGGQVVPEDTVIAENAELLSFVKPAAIKG